MKNRERGEAGFSGWQTGRSPIGKTFTICAGDGMARFACWQQVADAEKHVADDFMDAVSSGDICHRVQPLEASPNHKKASHVCMGYY